MELRSQLRRAGEFFLAPVFLLTLAFLIAQARENVPAAAGQLSEYYGGEAASLYPGDVYPYYPGENIPLYPGDEKWNGHYHQISLYPRVDRVEVYDLATDGQEIYGAIEDVPFDGHSVFSLGQWQGEAWKKLSPGPAGEIQGQVYSLAVQGNKIYAGGRFTNGGGVGVNNVALWTGTAWDGLDGGITRSNGQPAVVNDMLVSGSSLYTAGVFDRAGGAPAGNIARWDGSGWTNLGGGVSSPYTTWVGAIAGDEKNLYVGGSFHSAGGVQAPSIARWDGTQWHTMGSGINGVVYAIAVDGSSVYVGGSFYQAGGTPASNVARWDGKQWHAMGAGLRNTVRSLTVSPKGVYAAGNFIAYTSPRYSDNIAFWNGASWSNLGSGVHHMMNGEGYVNDLLALNNRVYVGGSIEKAGNNLSSGLATWHEQPELDSYAFPYTPLVPGSSIYLIGRYYNAGESLTVKVNGTTVPFSPALTANADGKVYFHLHTSVQAQYGMYVVTLTPAGQSAGAQALNEQLGTFAFSIQAWGAMITPNWSGPEAQIPAAVKPMTSSQYVPQLRK